MPLLAERPVTVPMYFVRPHVKPGDYYLMINRINGRRMWVHPRHIGERNYAVTSSLGTDEPEFLFPPSSKVVQLIQESNLPQLLSPENMRREVQETRDELNRAQMIMKVAIGASIVTSALAVFAFWRN